MKATDLQARLAHLGPGETLLLPATEVEEAFHFYTTFEERRDAALALAVLYRCTLTVCEPGGSQILFTRHDGLEDGNSGIST
jgi:NADH:ubiquinone oxidoreductase subunit E